MATTNLLSPFRLGSLALKNRIVLAPLTRGRCGDEHVPGPSVAEYYRQRASAGLLISEATAISNTGQGWDGAPGIYTPEHVAGWKPVTEGVHAAGGLIYSQLWHMGRQTHTDFFGIQPVSASAIAAVGETHTPGNHKKSYEVPRALDIDEIPGVVEEYRHAAASAKEAGFDGVEIHSANGYLLDQFLQSVSNKRTDGYGGPVENRFRLLREVFAAVSSVFPTERIGVRLSPNGVYGSMGSEDNIETFQYAIGQLASLNIGYIHIMDGLGFGFHEKSRPFTLADARALYSGPIIGNCGYTPETAEAAIASSNADLIAFGRAFIPNPDLVERIANGWPLAQLTDYSALYRQYTDDDRNRGYTDFPVYSPPQGEL